VAIESLPATNIHAAIPNVSVEQIHEHVRGAEHSVAQFISPVGADGSGALVENFSLQGKNLFNGDVIFNHDNVDPFLSVENISRHGDFNIVPTCMDHGGGSFNMITSLSEVSRVTLQHLCKQFKIKANIKMMKWYRHSISWPSQMTGS
jgi:hypothetical protein